MRLRLAVISDIHGNKEAFHQTLADIKISDVDLTIGFCFDQILEGFGKKLIRIKGVVLMIEFQGNLFGLDIDYPKN
jgi:hypothetical protein